MKATETEILRLRREETEEMTLIYFERKISEES